MANVIINDAHLSAIGEAIRAKNGLTDTYKPSEMAAAIEAIVATGGGDSGGNSAIQYVQLTNEDGAKTYQSFDASAYIGTDDTTPFFLVIYGYYGNTSNVAAACVPNILYYDGAGTYSDILALGNSLNVASYITPSKCTVTNGVIKVGDGSSYFKIGKNSSSSSASTSTTNYIELFYVVDGVALKGEIEITENGAFNITEYASANVHVGLKILPIQGTDISASIGMDHVGYCHEFDLSPYVKEGDDFLLFYMMTKTGNYSTYTNAITGVFSPYNSSEEYTTAINPSAVRNITTATLKTFFGTGSADSVIYVNSNYKSTYTWENLKFTPGCMTSPDAILVYAG